MVVSVLGAFALTISLSRALSALLFTTLSYLSGLILDVTLPQEAFPQLEHRLVMSFLSYNSILFLLITNSSLLQLPVFLPALSFVLRTQ